MMLPASGMFTYVAAIRTFEKELMDGSLLLPEHLAWIQRSRIHLSVLWTDAEMTG